MKTLIDNESGAIVFIPQNTGDKNLLLHLMNCTDLTQFSEYLNAEQRISKHTMTSDLGVPVEEFSDYPCAIGMDNRYDRSSLSALQPATMLNVLPDFESEIQFNINNTRIGFCRDRS
jgi:hypothetical protein